MASSSSSAPSAAAPTPSWEEVRGLMQQLELLCSASAAAAAGAGGGGSAGGGGGGGGGGGAALSADTLRLLASARGELREVLGASQMGAKKVLHDLTRAVAAEHAAASELSTPLEGLRTQIEALEAAKSRVVLQLQALQSAKDVSGAAIARLLGDTMQYKERLADLQKDQSAQVPRTRHFLALYTIISAIKWDYEREGSGAAAAAVEGYIAPPGGAPVRPFRLDAALPPARLADALWAAVGEAHGLSA